MKISVKVDYACRVMAELARLHSSGELAQIEQLAKTEEVPASFLAQILGKLRTHGLIVSLVAVEGECLHLSGNVAGRSGRRMKQIWDEIGATLVKKTKSYTLNQLATKHQAEMYYI